MNAIWIVSTLIKATLLLLAGMAVAFAVRRASAAARHLVWGTVIVSLLWLPLAGAVMPWHVRVVAPGLRAVSPPATVTTRASPPAALPPTGSVGGGAIGAATQPLTPGPAPVAAATRLSGTTLLALLAAIWAVGALYLLGRLIVGVVTIARLMHRATPLDAAEWRRPLLEAADRLALDRLPRLMMSDRLPMPFTCGLLHPAIVLPPDAAAWDDGRRRAVLFHELAHLIRHDLVANTLGQLAAALYWFHPLAWLAVRRLRSESERACDDLVLGVGTRASEYADHLLQIVCRAARSRTPAVALPMAQRHEFEGRMLAILERVARREPASRRQAAGVGALALGLVLPLAALAPSHPAEAPPAAAAPAAAAPEARPPASTASPAATGAAPSRRPESLTGSARDSAQVVMALARALEDSVESVREGAAYALGRLEAVAAVPPLAARLLRDPAAKVREMCAWALAQIGRRTASTALSSAALRDSSEAVRGMAVWALGQLEDTSSVTALSAVLRDPSAGVRGRAAWALGTIQPPSAPPMLMAALRDPSRAVRLRAAWALGQIADSSAVPMLAVTLRDSTAEVRRAALWALGQIGGDRAQTALLPALQDPDPEVRARAVRALAGNRADPWPWPWPMPIIR